MPRQTNSAPSLYSSVFHMFTESGSDSNSFVESQNNLGWKGLLALIHALVRAVLAWVFSQVAQGFVQLTLEYLQGWGLQSLRATCSSV